MAFDGIVTKAITEELSTLNNSRIDKIFQPNKNEIILGLYLNKKNYALDICIDSQNCRINLTTHSKSNPQVAPNFCMLLRKNLIGLKLKNISTLDLERLIIMDFEGFDEIDDIISKKLIIELMGKHSNIILLDDTNIIIDSLRHIKEIDENYRDILPHTKYSFPTSNKTNFLELKNFNEFISCIIQQNDSNLNIDDVPTVISNTFNGISKSFINSIIAKKSIIEVNDNTLKTIFDHITEIIKNIGNNTLYFEAIKKENIIKDYFLEISSSKLDFEEFYLNFFIDDFYYNKDISETFKNTKNILLKLILATLKKYQKRLYNINDKLRECDSMNTYRVYGELITANLYRIPNENLESIELENYYENNTIISIPLDKRFLPSINAKKYFKKYSKLKNALEIVTKQKEDTIKELNYIESVIYELESSTNTDELTAIFEEISENEIFKEKVPNKSTLEKNQKSKIKKSKLTKNKTVSFNPIKYIIDGYTILVGRNNKENDYLTMKYSSKNDIWFHTKDFHGSHTILKVDPALPYPSENLLFKVAQIAAKHSKAKNSSNIPVDYCEVKYVKKPSGSKPGMVIYTNNKTLYV